MKTILAVGLLLLLSACAAGPQQRVLRAAGAPVELQQVPFFAQDAYQCGPAALATVLVAAGVEVSPEQLLPQIYVPGRRGSLQAELLAATRRHGRVPYLLPGELAPILAELRAGRPVLVFQNLGLQRLPVWHYAVLIGFDPEREQFVLRSGREARVVMDARPFLASWDRAGRWAMAASLPSVPPAETSAVRWLQAVAPFESLGELGIAAQGYEAAVQRWPQDAAAWTALGNVRYRQQDVPGAETAYRQALTLAPTQWVARNNLVSSLIERRCATQAQVWIETAGTPPPAMATAWAQTVESFAAAGEQDCAEIVAPAVP